MMRRLSASSSISIPTTARRGLAASIIKLQRQHEYILSQQHGAGFVRHDAPLGGEFRPAKAPDLQHSDVHLGFGTSENDPYVRTLPNMATRPPESTVLTAGSERSPTMDEVNSLGTRWGTLTYWLSDAYPRLPLYLDNLQSKVAARVAFTHEMEARLDSFEADVPSILSQYGSNKTKGEVVGLINKAKSTLDALADDIFISPLVFDEKLSAAKKLLESQLHGFGLSFPEVDMVAHALVVKCGHVRNDRLSSLRDFVRHQDVANSSALWDTFFSQAELRFAELGLTAECRFVWDHQCRHARLPAMTAPVALYFSLCCSLLRNASTSTKAPVVFRAVDAPVAAKKSFLRRVLPSVISSAPPQDFLTSLKEDGISNDICEALAVHNISNIAEVKTVANEVSSLVNLFQEYRVADSYLQLLLQNCQKEDNLSTRQTLMRLFAVQKEAARDLRGAVNRELTHLRQRWASHYVNIAQTLLSDFHTMVVLESLISNEKRGNQDKGQGAEHVKALRQVIQARRARADDKARRASILEKELSDYSLMDKTIRALGLIGVSVRELEAAAAETISGSPAPSAPLDTEGVGRLLQQMATTHPAWVTSNVLDTTPHALSASSTKTILSNLVKIFIRQTWVPHAGQATLKARTRRRIGPIGLEPTQQNIAAEIGQVEIYDNLLHKRFDWQGWYQRMVDIHNRNISVKCRIDDLKQLDNEGQPFVDLQSERRLRVVAAERVGRGILKLDSDRFEDQHDNLDFGLGKLSEVLADARKTTLGEEYWPSVEVKVRRPSGQSKMRYSIVDDARIEARSKELYEAYKATKAKKVFVTPMDTWLDVTGLSSSKSGAVADQDGYNVESLYATMEDAQGGDKSGSSPA